MSSSGKKSSSAKCSIPSAKIPTRPPPNRRRSRNDSLQQPARARSAPPSTLRSATPRAPLSTFAPIPPRLPCWAPASQFNPIRRTPTLQSISDSILLESPMEQYAHSRRTPTRLLAGFYSTVALLLAAIRFSGVIDYAAVRWTREIGIRIALGARHASVVPPHRRQHLDAVSEPRSRSESWPGSRWRAILHPSYSAIKPTDLFRASRCRLRSPCSPRSRPSLPPAVRAVSANPVDCVAASVESSAAP